MNKLLGMLAFVRVVECGGFTSAAQRLGLREGEGVRVKRKASRTHPRLNAGRGRLVYAQRHLGWQGLLNAETAKALTDPALRACFFLFARPSAAGLAH